MENETVAKTEIKMETGSGFCYNISEGEGLTLSE
jgi:hypothetical protein